MIKKDPLRFGPGRAWCYWLMFVLSVALVLTAGVHLANRDDLEKTGRSVTTPAGKDDTSNATIIDKDQRIEVDENSPFWPFIEELRSASPRSDSPATDSKEE
ncbi:hypothetical protein [Streptosporangium sp. NBC_01756]|uniref:hypothetical protein n=1 Tax=Streptosporangium sp. NBC_01756 TaxID=2975950 RepID=UPI002DD7DA3B|nr:hypothetical protein [Streptosporangium sp. NBC_01756]WSC89472.1 hypothetical protein OIE48_15210 [Streptosporangium sp. NBC_01756]